MRVVKIMNKNTNETAIKPQQSAVAQIMAMCRVVTPQFYKGLSQTDVQAEKATIELLTQHIDSTVISRMCELAIKNYGTARSDNSKIYFDINYVLSFYRTAFNEIWCSNINLPIDAKRISDEYDPISRIITEYWQDNNGKNYVIKYIADTDYNVKLQHDNASVRHYTPKYYEMDNRYWNEQAQKFINDTKQTTN